MSILPDAGGRDPLPGWGLPGPYSEYVGFLFRWGDARELERHAATPQDRARAELATADALGRLIAFEMDRADILLFDLRMALRHRRQAVYAMLDELAGMSAADERLDALRADVDELAAVLAGGVA